jgi:D-alanine--poly(phosphoribitol) ligase subunit 1
MFSRISCSDFRKKVGRTVSDPISFEPVIHRAVSRHAASRPDATALICGNRRISYGTLDAAANAYAAELVQRGVDEGHVVPLLLPRSPRLAALQLAVLKCGAAYATLDQHWPARRQAAILGQISPALVVGRVAGDRDRFGVYEPPEEDIRSVADRASAFDAAQVDGSAPATVFFTSGSTGGAKGVICPHRAVTRLFRPGGLPGFGPGHAIPQAAALPWDMYAFELWGQLTQGGTSVLIEGSHFLPRTLRDLVRDAGVDTLFLTTSLFNLFVDEDLGCFAGLSQVLIGGEKLSPEHVRVFLEGLPGVPLWNGYGPAENCMVTTTHLLRLADCDVPGGVPIGRAVPGTTVLVLDTGDRLCAAGQSGEICIAGDGLAAGYLGRPRLTDEKFPVVDVNGDRIRVYRTGDIGAADEAGVLHFRGRLDRQVKISGYRVEMSEIEEATRRLTGIRDCAALPLAAPDGRVTALALFYLIDPDHVHGGEDQPDVLGVHEQLTDLLPSYLVPGVVRWLTQFPLTANGKLDRSALVDMARSSRGRSRRSTVTERVRVAN